MPDGTVPTAIAKWRDCPLHPGATLRHYRTIGAEGPGAYIQCIPSDGEPRHLLGRVDRQGVAARPMLSTLTVAERDVLDDAACGLTVKESASTRSRSPETIKTQRSSVLLKVGARSMTHAVAITAGERT